MMRRILLVMAVAAVTAMMMALSAGPAFAAGATQNGNNCLGSQQSGAVAGPGGLPGSPVSPAPGFTNPETGGPTWNGPYTSYYAQQPGSSVGEPNYPNGPSGYQAGYYAPTYANCGG